MFIKAVPNEAVSRRPITKLLSLNIMAMDPDQWDSVLQFVGEPLDLTFKDDLDESAPSLQPVQIPTPPVSIALTLSFLSC